MFLTGVLMVRSVQIAVHPADRVVPRRSIGLDIPGGKHAAKHSPSLPDFIKVVVDPRQNSNGHKAKVIGRFSNDGANDVGVINTGDGFYLYRYKEHWKPYKISSFAAEAEDAQAADVNGDGATDIIIGGLDNQTGWLENPRGQGMDPYTTQWKLHTIDTTRSSHDVVVGDIDHDGKLDVATNSGFYFQGTAKRQGPDDWTFVSIPRVNEGTWLANILDHRDGYLDLIAPWQGPDGAYQLAWFENPGHTGGNPRTGTWTPHIIDPLPGGPANRKSYANITVAARDFNGDGRLDVAAVPMYPDKDASTGDGLVWYEAPKDPRGGTWIKHPIDRTIGWVHQGSLRVADFDGDGRADIGFAEQEQSSDRTDGVKLLRRVGIFYNRSPASGGHPASRWELQLLASFPHDPDAGGHNIKEGRVGEDRLPSLLVVNHGFFQAPNPVILWRNQGARRGGRVARTR